MLVWWMISVSLNYCDENGLCSNLNIIFNKLATSISRHDYDAAFRVHKYVRTNMIFNRMRILALLLLITVAALIEAIGSALKPIRGSVKVGKIQLSPIGVGTWAWGNRFLWQYNQEDDDELQRTFNYVVSQGVNWFDTADSYGTGELEGQSEKLLGRFDAAYRGKNRGQAKFATKLAPFPTRVGREPMYRAGLESVERLQRPIDIVQLHWPPYWVLPQLNDWFTDEYLCAFSRLIEEKQATQIGVSNYGPKSLRRVDAAAHSAGTKVYSNQVQFSLLSRYPLENGLAETCAELGIQPIGYSPLALGLLADKYKYPFNLPSDPRSLLFREFLPKIEPLLMVLRDIASKRGKSVSQVVLNWNLQKGFLLLVGVRSVQQAQENLGAVGWSLSAGEIDVIDKAARCIKGQLVQNSFQTD